MSAPVVTGLRPDMRMAAGAHAERAAPAARVPSPGGRRDTGRRGFRIRHAACADPALGYLTKYQFSGLMPSVGLCGVAPLRLPAISVSEYTPFGWNITGNCCAR